MSKTEDKQLTEMQAAFLEALFTPACGGNHRKAMQAAGYSDNTPTSQVVEPLKDQIVDLARTHIAVNAPKAVIGLTGVLDEPQMLGAKNVIAAAVQVLDRAGLVKTEKVEVDNKGAGIFILPPKEPANDS